MAFDAIVWWSGVELCRQVQAEFHHVSDDQLTPEGNWFFPPPGPARIPQNRGGGEQQQTGLKNKGCTGTVTRGTETINRTDWAMIEKGALYSRPLVAGCIMIYRLVSIRTKRIITLCRLAILDLPRTMHHFIS